MSCDPSYGGLPSDHVCEGCGHRGGNHLADGCHRDASRCPCRAFVDSGMTETAWRKYETLQKHYAEARQMGLDCAADAHTYRAARDEFRNGVGNMAKWLTRWIEATSRLVSAGRAVCESESSANLPLRAAISDLEALTLDWLTADARRLAGEAVSL